MSKLYEAFGAEESAYVKECRDDYFRTMRGIADGLYAGHENDECFIFPHQLGVPFEYTLQYCYYICGAPYLYFSGVISYKDRKFEQMENYFRLHGMFDHDLSGRMTNCSDGDPGLYGDVYYTVNGEQIWLEAWKARGEHAKAADMMKALLRYGVTGEYIVSERYCSLDPWYSPWQPNASSCGRMIKILLDYYGERSAEQ